MQPATDFVLFGGTGDLTFRKLLPALYRAFKEQSLPLNSLIYTTCRSQQQVDDYLDNTRSALHKNLNTQEFDATIWDQFAQLIKPIMLDISSQNAGWEFLVKNLRQAKQAQRIFYFAIAPSLYGECSQRLNEYQLIHSDSRVVVEKPIGYDRDSAEKVNRAVAQFFSETQIFRIDHYLGKETVQNLMVLRFSNLLFENMWDKKSIDHIQISISETVGLEGRAGFYNDAGALRDMVQNHLLQLLCLVAMEPPNKLNSENIRTEKLKVLQALRPISQSQLRHDTIRGQYVAGETNGKLVSGYLEELEQANSFCETFVAIKAQVDNWRWSGVPFYLRTGKRLAKRSAEIIVQFKAASHNVFSSEQGNAQPNKLVIQLQPNEKIQMQLNSKNLGLSETQLQSVNLNLNLTEKVEHFYSDAYKRLLLDVVANDPSLFIHRDEIDQAWAWIDPIINGWKASNYQPELYRAGTWGPESANQLLTRDARSWHNAQE